MFVRVIILNMYVLVSVGHIMGDNESLHRGLQEVPVVRGAVRDRGLDVGHRVHRPRRQNSSSSAKSTGRCCQE